MNIITLLDLARQNDSQATNEIIKKYEKLMYLMIKDYKYDKKEGYSLYMLSLAKAIKTYDKTKKISFCTYLYTILKNEFLMDIRKKKRKMRSEMKEEFYSEIQNDKELKYETDLFLLEDKNDVIADCINDIYYKKKIDKCLKALRYDCPLMRQAVYDALFTNDFIVDISNRYGFQYRTFKNKLLKVKSLLREELGEEKDV